VSEAKAGRFWLGPDRAMPGELRIAGRDSELVLHDEREISLSQGERFTLHGNLHDHSRVALADCLLLDQSTHVSHAPRDTPRAKAFSARIFPHFIVQGRSVFPVDEACVRTISLTFEDAAVLFYDFDAFGSVTAAEDAQSLIQTIGELHKKSMDALCPLDRVPRLPTLPDNPSCWKWRPPSERLPPSIGPRGRWAVPPVCVSTMRSGSR